jgi:hypothetical protein
VVLATERDRLIPSLHEPSSGWRRKKGASVNLNVAAPEAGALRGIVLAYRINVMEKAFDDDYCTSKIRGGGPRNARRALAFG